MFMASLPSPPPSPNHPPPPPPPPPPPSNSDVVPFLLVLHRANLSFPNLSILDNKETHLSESEITSNSSDSHVINIIQSQTPNPTDVDIDDPFSKLIIGMVQIQQAQDGDRSAREKMNLGKIFVGLTFQAALAMALSFQPPSVPMKHPLHLNLFQISMVVGFSASLMGILLRSSYTFAASKLEKVGSFFATLGCFVLMSTFLSADISWIVWVAFAALLLAFIASFCRRCV